MEAVVSGPSVRTAHLSEDIYGRTQAAVGAGARDEQRGPREAYTPHLGALGCFKPGGSWRRRRRPCSKRWQPRRGLRPGWHGSRINFMSRSAWINPLLWSCNRCRGRSGRSPSPRIGSPNRLDAQRSLRPEEGDPTRFVAGTGPTSSWQGQSRCGAVLLGHPLRGFGVTLPRTKRL